jgi:hypothetical protein
MNPSCLKYRLLTRNGLILPSTLQKAFPQSMVSRNQIPDSAHFISANVPQNQEIRFLLTFLSQMMIFKMKRYSLFQDKNTFRVLQAHMAVLVSNPCQMPASRQRGCNGELHYP